MTEETAKREPRGKLIAFWVLTALLMLPMAFGGVMDIVQPDNFIETFNALGYPLYLGYILGVAKLLGVVVLLIPGFPRLKEWAYAGFVIDLIGAGASHAFVGDYAGLAAPVIILGFALGSYFLRPANRRL